MQTLIIQSLLPLIIFFVVALYYFFLPEVSVSSLMGRSLSAPQLSAGGLGGKTLQFVSVSESHYDHTHHTHHHHEETPEPHLALTNDSREVYLGATATLDCTVHDLTNQSVRGAAPSLILCLMAFPWSFVRRPSCHTLVVVVPVLLSASGSLSIPFGFLLSVCFLVHSLLLVALSLTFRSSLNCKCG